MVVAAAAAYGAPVSEKLVAGVTQFEDPSSESAKVRDQFANIRGFDPDNAVVAVVRTSAPAASLAGRRKIGEIAQRLGNDPAITWTASFSSTDDRAFLSRDGHGSYVIAGVGSLSPTVAKQSAERLIDEFSGDPRVTLGGNPIADVQFAEEVSNDLRRAELTVLPLLLLLLIVVFRGVVAAFLPLVVGLIAIVGATVGLRLAADATTVSIYALNLATGLGLGLSIDYSLLIVSRYREELARVGPGSAALIATMNTAGRTVLFSALTVAGVLASLLVFPVPFLYSMGVAGVFVAVAAGLAALVVLPLLLGTLGKRVNALRLGRRRREQQSPEARPSPVWGRIARGAMSRPLVTIGLTTALLVALGSSFLRVDFTYGDPSALPETASARQVHDALRQDFVADPGAPLLVAPESSTYDQSEVLTTALRSIDGVAYVTPIGPTSYREERIVSEVTPDAPVISDESENLVQRLRDLDRPTSLEVGGYTAGFVDLKESIVRYLPIVLVLVSCVVLIAVLFLCRSVVLALKTLLLNVLTGIATLGVLVLIFQDGRFEQVLDFSSSGAIGTTEPIVLLILSFAISTDYAVFLLARIKEEHDRGKADRDAVAAGLERTGRIVTAAAVLFAVALGALVLSDNVYVKQLGLGAAVAVLIDATIIRGLLVPALMATFGRWNWWAPRWINAAAGRFDPNPNAKGAQRSKS